MSLFSKVGTALSNEATRLPNRFVGGFMPMGAVTRPPRANTADELANSIQACVLNEKNAAVEAKKKLFELTQNIGLDLNKLSKENNVDLVGAARIASNRVEDMLIATARSKGIDLVARIENNPRMTIADAARCCEELTGNNKIKNLIEASDKNLVKLAKSKLYHEFKGKELEEFSKQMDSMNPEHLGLAHDVIDLSKVHEMLNTNINLNKKISNGKTILGHILEMLPEVSKKNPGALELAESVINNSDTQNAKYFLARLFDFDLPNMGSLSEQMKAVKDIVPTIAKDTLSGGFTMDFKANEEFFSFIKELASADAKPENVKLLSKIQDILEKTSPKIQHSCDIQTLKRGNTERIKENLEVLPEVLKNADSEGKPIKVAHFLENNINLD